jgi:hypothetical protein
MSETKFTPGPWTVIRYPGASYGLFQVQPFATRQRKRFLGEDTTLGTREEAEANAHLIAAAPTMADYVRRRAEAGDPEAARIWEIACGRS